MKTILKPVFTLVLLAMVISGAAGQSSTRRQPSNFPLVVRVNVQEAEVMVNKVPVKGPFPQTMQLAAGSYEVTAKAKGYTEFRGTAQVTEKGGEINIVLQAEVYNVTFTSNAVGSLLSLNRQNYTLPTTISLAPGVYALKATAPGFKDFNTNLNVTGNTNFPITLEALTYPVTLSLNVPGAKVVFNKNLVSGRLPQTFNVTAGEYEVTALAPGYKPFVASVQVQDRAVTFPIVLELQRATIRASNVTIVLDDIEQPAGTFDVSPGRRKVKVMLGKQVIGEKMMVFEPNVTYDLEIKYDFEIKKANQ